MPRSCVQLDARTGHQQLRGFLKPVANSRWALFTLPLGCSVDFLGLQWPLILLADPKADGPRSTTNAVPPATLKSYPPKTSNLHSNMSFCCVQSQRIHAADHYGSTRSGVEIASWMLQQAVAHFSSPGMQSRSCSPSLDREESAGSSTSFVTASQSTTLLPSSRRALLTPRSLTPS